MLSDMAQPDHYKTLQVDPAADPEVIEAAYHRLARKYHPDTNPAPDATARMAAINAAYDVLGDPGRRARYDLERMSPQSAAAATRIEAERRRAEERLRRASVPPAERPHPAEPPRPYSHSAPAAPTTGARRLGEIVLAAIIVLAFVALIAGIGIALSGMP